MPYAAACGGEGNEGSERWSTYSDLIKILMIFLLLLIYKNTKNKIIKCGLCSSIHISYIARLFLYISVRLGSLGATDFGLPLPLLHRQMQKITLNM
jgi:hypothetical protein